MLYAHYKIRKITFILLLLFFAISNFSFASGVRSHFMHRGPGIAAAGLGGAFTAAGDDVSVVYYNPSLLHKFPASYVSASNTFLYGTARYSFMGFSYGLDNSAFAITATQLHRGNIEVRQLITDAPTYTQNSKLLFTGAYSGEIRRLKLSYGAAINYLQYNIYEYSDFGLGLDLSLSKRLWTFGDPMATAIIIDSGLNLKNIIQKPIKLISYPEGLPFMIKAGLAARLTLFPRYDRTEDRLSYDELLFAININRYEDKFHNSIGIQYRLFDRFIFRLGYSDNLSFGAGLNWGNIKFDYGYSLKSFGGFHNIGFTYSFGHKEIDPVKRGFTEEFQEVYRKARRIYGRFLREARHLAARERTEDAISLLKKAVPLNPEDAEAERLIKVYQKTILADKTNEYISEGNKYRAAQETVQAYKSFLTAFDSNPQKHIFNLLDNLYNSASAAEKKQLDEIKKTYINNLTNKINQEIIKDNFFLAEEILNRLIIFTPGDITNDMKAELEDKRNLYLFRLVASGMERMRDEEFIEAYKYFHRANQINPEDDSIRDQQRIARGKFLQLKNYSLKDDLYSEKLYYLAAIQFATDEHPLPLYNKLKSFNPLFAHLPLLEDSLRQKGILTGEK